MLLKAFQQDKLKSQSCGESHDLPVMQVVTFFFWVLFMLFNKTSSAVEHTCHESSCGDSIMAMKCMAHQFDILMWFMFSFCLNGSNGFSFDSCTLRFLVLLKPTLKTQLIPGLRHWFLSVLCSCACIPHVRLSNVRFCGIDFTSFLENCRDNSFSLES